MSENILQNIIQKKIEKIDKLKKTLDLKVLNELPQDVPLLIEHLESQEEYDKAARYIQNIANKENIKLR